ncbi:MAG: hypothetical protein NWR72_16225 [Bacteroidia bacterium]|nr:hypothetical protein [Bacteroidia bacterium]
MQLISRLLLIVAVAALMSSCEKDNVLIDNGGEEKLTVVVNAITYTMPPKTSFRVQLEPGTHSFSIKGEDGKELEEGRFQVTEGGLLNAAKTEYLIWAEWYGDPSKKEETLKQEWIKVDDLEIYGEFIRIPGEDIFVEKQWDYSIDEELPESVQAWEMGSKRWVIKRKLFRLDDAMQHYQTVSAPSP